MTGAPVLIVEDHELLAQSLGLALDAEGFRVTVALLTDPAELMARVAADPPALVLLDLDLGERFGDGTRLIPELLATGTRVLVVTGVTDRTRVAAAVEAGAIGYLPKSQPFDDLLDTIRAAVAGEPVLSDAERHDLLAGLRRWRAADRETRKPFERLTPRESQVLAALGNGQSVDTIAKEWVVSEATVRTQVRGVLTKLGVNSQLAAVAMARHAGWLSAGD